ncbi:MAG: alpha-D-ribose 1-methylphosphonate 5-triphosphate diphosphatase [Desulfofustis sp.]|jgi:alpha-D-ribose 1-methylphosphonate 5-triphosphate diphosphatase|nr:alpha-D-ribose 1-methylphosphonate 5-triphosphate diphosphatase [Desulfofustis sp.]
MEYSLRNARVVTRGDIFSGSVQVQAGLIAAVDQQQRGSVARRGIDCEGDLLLPGLIELHTDNLEKNIQPRPGVIWPSMLAAAVAHDSQVAGAGITTVFDAIAVGGWRANSLRTQILADSLAAIDQGNRRGFFRAEHLIHLRCELADERLEELLDRHGSNAGVRLLSLMDHTPGQRQWSDISKWRLYHREKKWTDEEADAIVRDLVDRQQRYAICNRRLVVALARERQLVLASHDDTTIEDCIGAAEDGVAIAEFPTTLSAARAAHQYGMAVVMGAPNAVRGESHSGNVPTDDVAAAGLLDGLSSDYVPASLLHAAFLLADRCDLPLSETIAMVTVNNAEMAGLTDRGEISVGKRADLVRVSVIDSVPVVRQVWRQGHQVC